MAPSARAKSPSAASETVRDSSPVSPDDVSVGLGKRKRGANETRSSSPTLELEQPKRKRGRPRKVPDVSDDTVETVVTGVVKSDLLKPATHPRPPRQLFVFGNGDMGQFGLGTETLGDIVRPRLHAWFEAAIQNGSLGDDGAGLESVCAGGMHSLVIDERGHILSWGINDNASLGRPTVNVPDPNVPDKIIDTEVLETEPLVVQNLVDSDFRAVEVAAGDSVSVALGSQGELRVWGSFRSSDGLLGFDGKEGSPKTQITPLALPTLTQYQFVAVACGTDHVLALSATGHVYVWGNGQQAQLGRRIIERRKTNGLAPERLALRKIVRVGSGSYHSFAVDRKGVVYAWGLNSLRQTGVSDDEGGTEAIVSIPTPVSALNPKKLNGRTVTAIVGGEHHTLFLLSDGSVWGCGRCDGSELGLADDHPAKKALEKRRNDALVEWKTQKAKEAAKKSRKGTGAEKVVKEESKPPMMDEFVPEPVPIVFPPPPTSPSDADSEVPAWQDSMWKDAPLDPVVHISVNSRHNLAVTKAGHVYAWGFGNQCQLGLGRDVEMASTPQRVRSKAMEGWIVEKAAAGGQHCLLLARKPSDVQA